METYQKFDGDEQLIWDASSINMLMACPYKYLLGRVQGWRMGSRSGNLKADWGTAWHACQDVYDESIFYGKNKDEALGAAIRRAYDFKEMLNPPLGEFQKVDNTRTLESLIRALVWFRDKWDVEPCETVATPEGTPSVEIRFEVPLVGTKYRISGRVDKLVEMDGSIYVVDRKTTGLALGKWYFDAYSVDNQIRTYVWALREQLGIPIAGFIIDAVQTQVNGTRFDRAIFDVTKDQTAEWLRSIISHVDEVESYVSSEEWPQRYSSCGLYGGCQFRKICSRPGPFREAYLESDFRREPRPDQRASSGSNLVK